MKAILVLLVLLVLVVAYKAVQKYRHRDISGARRESGAGAPGETYFDPESTLAGAPPETPTHHDPDDDRCES